MKIQKFSLIMFCISFLLFSCNFNNTYYDREEDKIEAEKITLEAYNLLEEERYSETYPLYSPKFWSNVDTTNLDLLYKTTEERLGKIKSKTLDTWNTTRIEGDNESTTYVLIYKVEREKFQSVEKFSLEKIDNEIKILGYFVNSEGLLN